MVKATKGIKKLNLGCGIDIRKGFINIDFEDIKGVDIVFDLNNVPYPFKDNQFEHIIMKNILEHLNDPYKTMQEIHRISCKGAIVEIQTPHFSSDNAWGDLQHKRGFNSATFKNPNISGRFGIMEQKITFPNHRFFMRSIANLNTSFYERHLAYILPAIDLVVKLVAKK
ncbi:MAG: methyltransferase domain-containing protein [archaeon]